MDREELKDTIFSNDETLYGSKIVPVTAPTKEIGIDLERSVAQNIANSLDDALKSTFDVSKLESFSNVSRSRNDIYQTLDYMAEDSIISAVLETYAEDATEANDNGDIMWVEAADGDVAKYITYLLNSLDVNKNIYGWTYSLCKYGDLYLRLYRESDYDSILFKKKRKNQEGKNTLNEDVNIKIHSKNDRYVHYIEQVDNPAQVFELTRFGKTAAYIKTDVQATNQYRDNLGSTLTSYLQKYAFNSNDIDLFEPTEFVHGCLQDNTSRVPEEVDLFIDDSGDETKTLSYKVKRGQSLLYGTYKIWRQLMLLENSVLLNRITQSSVVRMIGVEVGDMPKEAVRPHIAGIKQLIEQKSALDLGNSMSEYTNPGPIVNNVYIPTRNGQGGITTQQIGGDVDVKSLADLEYYQSKMFGSLRVPKQYFGVTNEDAGFSGGASLSIISSRYAKMIKRIQNTMIQTITDVINLILLDTENQNYINKFVLKMMPPTTQEEVDRRDNISNKVALVGDIMNNLADIDSSTTRLKILKSLLGNTISNPEIIQLIEDEIEKTENEAVAPIENESVEQIEEEPANDLSSLFDENSEEGIDFNSIGFEPEVDEEESSVLPTPAELNIGDLSDSTNPELA